jgi:hypothetical protein
MMGTGMEMETETDMETTMTSKDGRTRPQTCELLLAMWIAGAVSRQRGNGEQLGPCQLEGFILFYVHSSHVVY